MEKKYIEATTFLTIAINLDPLNFQFYLDKLNCLKNFTQYNEAFDLINLMIEKFPTSAEAFYEKGEL
jgi:hypothetical protein